MAKTIVEFEFAVDQKVTTVFGDIGIVKMVALDDTACKKVFVQRSTDCQWFKENELTPVE
jgi:hypothetical protein